jgi:hypothetical protein
MLSARQAFGQTQEPACGFEQEVGTCEQLLGCWWP